MNGSGLSIVILGLSITSSWGNGHATTYRGLVRELAARGHRVLFLERDVPWYATSRDLQILPGARIALYDGLDDLRNRFEAEIAEADAVVVGSYVPEGAAVGEWVLDVACGVTAFYDIDTPVTLAKLRRGETDYLAPGSIPRFDLYLSFTGGPVLNRIEQELGSPRARALYCSVDPAQYYPEPAVRKKWDLGFLGTYSPDRQPALAELPWRRRRRKSWRRYGSKGPPRSETSQGRAFRGYGHLFAFRRLFAEIAFKRLPLSKEVKPAAPVQAGQNPPCP